MIATKGKILVACLARSLKPKLIGCAPELNPLEKAMPALVAPTALPSSFLASWHRISVQLVNGACIVIPNDGSLPDAEETDYC